MTKEESSAQNQRTDALRRRQAGRRTVRDVYHIRVYVLEVEVEGAIAAADHRVPKAISSL